MKNLKKVLALVLAFACAFTMFAGAASFTDEADISENNRDAVELLTTLKIIKGYEDGSFDPEGTVDRAEMAKMIYTIRNGGNDNASAHVGNTTSFTDISGHWAEGYIKYLQNTGIVAGKSATQFAPDAQVTTAEAMKMALALAGYDEKNAGLTGIDWQKNTLTYATTIGLTDDVNSAMSAGCSRQDAAQILANVLEANAVRYSSIVENFVNDSKTGLSYGGDPITVGYKWMDLTIYVGKLVSSGELNIDGVADAGKDRFSVVVDTVNNVEWNRWNWNDVRDYWNRADRTLTVKDGQDHTDLVGQEVKLLTGEKIDDVYGVYATGTSNVVETTMDQIDVENNWELSIGNDTYDTRGAAVYADLNTAADVEDVFTNNGEAVADTVKLIDWDNDDDYETILVNTVAVAEVSYVGSSSVTLGSYGSRVDDILDDDLVLDIDDNTIYEDIAKDDYAVATMNTYNDSWIVEKAETVSGEVNGRVANERKVCINDTWYTLANDKTGAADDDSDLYTINGTRSDLENGDDIMLVIVGDIAYYAESVSGNDANRSVAMVYDTYMKGNSWNGTPQAKIILANGDKLTVDVDLINGKPVEANGDEIKNLTPGAMYYYEINNDDEYSFTTLAQDGEDAGYDIVAENNNKGVDGSRVNATDPDTTYTIADEAIVFAYISDKKDAEVYSGEALKNANVDDGWGKTPNGQVLADNHSGFTYARMLNVSITEDEKFNNITNYGYMVTDSVRMTRDGVRVMRYTYWNGEEVVTSYEETNSNREPDIKKGTIIGFSLGEDDLIKDVKYANWDNRNDNDLDLVYASMSGYDADGYIGVIDWNNISDTREFDGDTLAYYVNADAANQEDIGVEGSGLNYDLDADQYGRHALNIAYILDNDDTTIKFIVIDVDGNLVDKYVGGNGQQPGGDDDVNAPVVDGDFTMTTDKNILKLNDTDGMTVTISNLPNSNTGITNSNVRVVDANGNRATDINVGNFWGEGSRQEFKITTTGATAGTYTLQVSVGDQRGTMQFSVGKHVSGNAASTVAGYTGTFSWDCDITPAGNALVLKVIASADATATAANAKLTFNPTAGLTSNDAGSVTFTNAELKSGATKNVTLGTVAATNVAINVGTPAQEIAADAPKIVSARLIGNMMVVNFDSEMATATLIQSNVVDGSGASSYTVTTDANDATVCYVTKASAWTAGDVVAFVTGNVTAAANEGGMHLDTNAYRVVVGADGTTCEIGPNA